MTTTQHATSTDISRADAVGWLVQTAAICVWTMLFVTFLVAFVGVGAFDAEVGTVVGLSALLDMVAVAIVLSIAGKPRPQA